MKLLVSAGCLIEPDDLEYALVKPLPAGAASLLTYLAGVYPSPRSLKQSCKLMLRGHCVKPLVDGMSHIGLPSSLVNYLLLDVQD